jgi:hypothetical protein
VPDVPNVRLEALLQRANLSRGAFARQLNVRGRARKVNLAVDTTRVSRWVKGEHPRDPVPELLLELLSERLGVRLTLAEIGMTHTGSDPLHPGWPSQNAVEALHLFAGSDMLTRRDLMSLVVGTPLLVATERLWQTTMVTPRTAPSRRIGAHEVTALETMTEYLRDQDAAHGGALFRRTTVAHLDTVADLLQAHQPPALAVRLQAVGIDLAQLAGWMSHDAGMYGTDQRYWAYAIAMARAAKDTGRAAEVMSRMAHQMIYLGRHRDALRLLDLAAITAPASGSLRLQAMITAQRGVHAALGHHYECRTDLDHAHRTLAEAQSTAEPVPAWIAYFTPAELAGATATSRRDLAILHNVDIGPASAAYTDALALRGPGYERVQALDLVGLAAAHLDEGRPEQAWDVADQALDAAERLDSALINARVMGLLQAADRQSHHPRARELRDRARQWHTPGVRAA